MTPTPTPSRNGETGEEKGLGMGLGEWSGPRGISKTSDGCKWSEKIEISIKTPKWQSNN